MNLQTRTNFRDASGNTVFNGTVQAYIDDQIERQSVKVSEGNGRYTVNGYELGKAAYSYAVAEAGKAVKRLQVAEVCKAMTDEEWLSGCRFYRSQGCKNCELPSGERVILRQETTEANFRELSKEFLLKMRIKAI